MDRAFDPYEQWLDIPPGPRPPDHYCLLGMAQFDVNAQQLHEQTMQRMSQVRRYQMGPQGEHALRLVQEISRAFDVLSDPARKAAYDSQLRTATTVEAAPQPAARPPNPPAEPIQQLPAAVVETVEAAKIETVSASPASPSPPRQMPAMRPVPSPSASQARQSTFPRVPPRTIARALRRRKTIDPSWQRYFPWLGGCAVVVVLIMLVAQLVGGSGTLLVQFRGLTPRTMVRLDGAPVDPQQLAKGQSVSMGMHKLEVSGPDIQDTVREFAVHRGQTTEFEVLLPRTPEATPAPKPPGPIAQASASPSTTSLLGSTWIGDDVYPNTSFTFEAGGVLNWSHDRGAYRTGTWRQTGSSLYFQQNDKFREFQGTIFTDQIVGNSNNVQGKHWTLSLRRATLASPQLANASAPAPSLLEGASWSGLDNNILKTFRFERGGVLSYAVGSQNYRNGTWKQTGNSVYFETNKQYREFRGTLKGDLLEGDSWNVQGLRWKTSIRRQ